jgi:hypothetical protein
MPKIKRLIVVLITGFDFFFREYLCSEYIDIGGFVFPGIRGEPGLVGAEIRKKLLL